MKISSKKIAFTATLLAICIASQYFKNLNVYFTGSVVNASLILCTLISGLVFGIILSIITPITAFLITGAPIMTVIPLLMPTIMVGNVLLCVFVFIFTKKVMNNKNVLIGGIIGSIIKSVFMTFAISYGLLLSVTLPEKMQTMLPVLQTTYSVTQLITAIIGTFISLAVWKSTKGIVSNK